MTEKDLSINKMFNDIFKVPGADEFSPDVIERIQPIIEHNPVNSGVKPEESETVHGIMEFIKTEHTNKYGRIKYIYKLKNLYDD